MTGISCRSSDRKKPKKYHKKPKKTEKNRKKTEKNRKKPKKAEKTEKNRTLPQISNLGLVFSVFFGFFRFFLGCNPPPLRFKVQLWCLITDEDRDFLLNHWDKTISSTQDRTTKVLVEKKLARKDKYLYQQLPKDTHYLGSWTVL